MEKLRGRADLSAALSAITAAVVGVILNLAVWLGLHVLFGEVGTLAWRFVQPAWPVWTTIDMRAIALLAVAAVALFRLRLGIPATLTICAILGVATQFAA